MANRFVNAFKALVGTEGSSRSPFSGTGELGNSFTLDPLADGWSQNLNVNKSDAKNVPAVYASVMLIARAISQCYPTHIKTKNGEYKKITNSAAHRVLKMPNSYQESPSFLLNLIATALFEGEAFCLATRNDRGEVSSLNLLPPNTCSPMVDDETKSIFYSVGSSPLAEGGTDYVVPARDVMHLRFHTPRHPLIGESPIKAAALAININVALNKSQSAFFSQMSRPSGVISYKGTPDRPFLDAKQMESLKQAWANASQAMNQGKVPILGANMEFQPMGVTSQDAQLVEAQNMSIADIGRVFGVPSPLINDLANATLNNSESLMRSFLSMSLGSYIEHIERQFDRLFNLGNDEKIELNTAALLRTDFNGRIDGLSKAVQGGVMTPNEARAMESLGQIEGGDTAFLQKQMIPLDEIKELLARERENAEAQAQAPVVEETQENDISPEYAKLLIQDLIKQKKAAINHA